MSQKIRKAVLPVAGIGTRLLPVTKVIPKELLPVGNKPIIHHLVQEAVEAGITEIVMVISKGKEMIADYFDRDIALEIFLDQKGKTDLLDEVKKLHKMCHISYVRQPEPLGDGHAVLCAQKLVGQEPFLVLFGDDLILGEESAAKQLLKVFEEKKSSVMAVQTVPKEEVSKYGIIDGEKVSDHLYSVTHFVEKPSPENAPSNVAIIGKYVCTPEIFQLLEEHPSSHGNEIRLIDAFQALLRLQKVYGLEPLGKRYDTGNNLGYFEACLAYAAQDEQYLNLLRQFVQVH